MNPRCRTGMAALAVAALWIIACGGGSGSGGPDLLPDVQTDLPDLWQPDGMTEEVGAVDGEVAAPDLPPEDLGQEEGGGADVPVSCQEDRDCDDENACTTDRCVNGRCVLERRVCNDLDPCTIDFCDAAKGCGTLPVEGCVTPVCETAADCNDSDPCSQDLCDGTTGKCLYRAVVCDDGDPCTVDSCTPGVGCVSWKDGSCSRCVLDSECDDKDVCTTDRCADGVCTHLLTVCDDKNPCTQDRCDPKKGCLAVPLQGCGPCQSDQECNDEDVCTKDSCREGLCQHEEIPCDDGNSCTADRCARGPGYPYCVYENQPVGTPCDDGDPCTGPDLCNEKACFGEPLSCDDQDPCTQDSCDPGQGGCVHVRIAGCGTGCQSDAACNDNNLCTTDRCVNGVCQNAALACDDGNACTTDACDPTTGKCVFEAIPGCGTQCQVDADCNDSDVCTRDKCVNGTCQFNAVVCDDSNPCTSDRCVRGPGYPYCAYDPAPDGTACDDGNACTRGDQCVSKTCTGTAVSCDDGDPCTTDACDPATGKCSHTPVPNCNTKCQVDADCNDNDVCTRDKCVNGLCQFNAVVCNDNNPCTVNDRCVRGPGYPYCAYDPAPDGTACDDGNACTRGDQCVSKTCTGTAVSCDDGDPCTTDACDPATGKCSHTPVPNCNVKCQVDADCNDNDVCTRDKCVNGFCQFNAVVCNDNNPCTVNDRCVRGPGYPYCAYDPAPDGTTCDDGNACTQGDQCVSKTCTGTAVSCDDQDPCTTDACDSAAGGCTHTVIPGCVKPCRTSSQCDDKNPATCDCCCALSGSAYQCYNVASPVGVCPPCNQVPGCVQ